MRVLVTGATGFIGGSLTRELVKQDYEVRTLIRKGSNLRGIKDLNVELAEGDLRDVNSLENALDGCDALFHAAAVYSFWSPDPKQIYESNVGGTKNIMLAAISKKIKKVVYTSSESVIGIDKYKIGNEKGHGCLEDIPSDYKKSKYIAENAVTEMCSRGLPVVIVNPTTPIGAYDIKPTPTGKIILDYLNHKMFASVNTGLNVVDVEDVARGHILALEKGRIGERYLLGNKNLTLREIMHILEQITGIKAPRFNLPISIALLSGYVDEFLEGRILHRSPRIPVAAVKASRKFRHFDCSKAITELGLPQTPVEEAFAKAVKWFKENDYVSK